MVIFLLALVGLVVGLALDPLIVRLAVAEDDGDDASGEGEGPAERRLTSVHAEAGSLVVAAPSAFGGWARRLLVVGATAGLFAVAAAQYDDAGHLAIIAAYLCVLIVCASTDLLCYRVPNVVTYPAIAGGLAIGATMPDANIGEVVAGGALAGGILFVPALLTGGVGMGMGDVKLAAFGGLALGFTLAVPAMLLMALAGGAVAVVLLFSGRRRRGEPIPYAPFISAGVAAVLLWQGAAFVRLS